MGAEYDVALISLYSKMNRRDRVSGIIFNLPDLCSTVKSYDCCAIAQLANVFDVFCIAYNAGRPASSVGNVVTF